MEESTMDLTPITASLKAEAEYSDRWDDWMDFQILSLQGKKEFGRKKTKIVHQDFLDTVRVDLYSS